MKRVPDGFPTYRASVKRRVECMIRAVRPTRDHLRILRVGARYLDAVYAQVEWVPREHDDCIDYSTCAVTGKRCAFARYWGQRMDWKNAVTEPVVALMKSSWLALTGRMTAADSEFDFGKALSDRVGFVADNPDKDDAQAQKWLDEFEATGKTPEPKIKRNRALERRLKASGQRSNRKAR